MEKFFEDLIKEATRRDIKNKLNKDVKKPFEKLVSLEFEPKGIIVKTIKVCLN